MTLRKCLYKPADQD